MSRFFIDRPVFAWVIAIVLMVVGGLCIVELPIAQYPAIAPPSIAVTATYPGASAKTLEDTVTQVIEQKLNGLDHLRYIESSSESSGQVTITVTFDGGTDADIAQVQVQNKVSLATALLPEEVQRQGLRVTKSVKNFLIVVGFTSTDGRLDAADMADFIGSTVQDPVSRLPGVGDIQNFGSQYAMRIWLDPDKLIKYQLATTDVVSAVQAQNAQVSAGALGDLPSKAGQLLNATIVSQTRLRTAEEFAKIVLRVNTDGSRVLLSDVARIELGSESYTTTGRYNGKPAAGLAIKPAAGANALETVDAVKKKVEELRPSYPPGVEAIYPYDTTPFVRISIHEVVKTLIEAVVLVFLVMFLFLQSWRATIIPTIAVPVVLLGVFGIMAVAGFSINTLTLFGLVLAIGLLVDDAIVVVENVERVLEETDLDPKEATRVSMDEVSGALVGIGLVLCAAFAPMAFFSGSTGVIYRQFSLTIVGAVALSVMVALILTPALCATILKRPDKSKGKGHAKTGFFGWFNRHFDALGNRYAGWIRGFLGRRGLALCIYACIACIVAFLFWRTPTGFLPDEDQGVLFTSAQLPAGSTREQADAVLKRIENHFMEKEKDNIEGVFGVLGFSFAGSGQNQAFAFVKLKDWDERDNKKGGVTAILQRAMGYFFTFTDSIAFAFAPPAVLELGNATGFDVRIVDRGGGTHEELMNARNQMLGMSMTSPVLASVRPNGLDDTPEYRIEIDREKASALGLSLSDINTSITSIFGSAYVNDFIDKGRVKKVFLQGDAPFRMAPEDVNRWYLRNSQNQMVPFSAFSIDEWGLGSPKLERFNGLSAVSLLGQSSPGHSSGQAMDEVEKLAKQLPENLHVEWAGLSYEERLSGSQTVMLYSVALLMVFLFLAALYESWAIPFSVMMDMPLGALGVIAAVNLRSMPNDVYFQIGLITIIGLSAKNAILVIEFAKQGFDNGMSLVDAVVHASHQRLRPVIMTSMAFGFGVLPLALKTGAGSGSQNAIGTGVVGGTITTTLLGFFFIPLYFVIVLSLFRVKPLHPKKEGGENDGKQAANSSEEKAVKAEKAAEKKPEPAHV